MRLPRPYIPLEVRIEVMARLLILDGMTTWELGWLRDKFTSKKKFLAALLAMKFGNEQVHLDHQPALVNRQRYADTTGIHYDPPANDPGFLIYRTKRDHYIKTHVRGDGAQYSDTVLAKRERRRTRKKKKYKWPKRSFRR